MSKGADDKNIIIRRSRRLQNKPRNDYFTTHNRYTKNDPFFLERENKDGVSKRRRNESINDEEYLPDKKKRKKELPQFHVKKIRKKELKKENFCRGKNDELQRILREVHHDLPHLLKNAGLERYSVEVRSVSINNLIKGLGLQSSDFFGKYSEYVVEEKKIFEEIFGEIPSFKNNIGHEVFVVLSRSQIMDLEKDRIKEEQMKVEVRKDLDLSFRISIKKKRFSSKKEKEIAKKSFFDLNVSFCYYVILPKKGLIRSTKILDSPEKKTNNKKKPIYCIY